MLHLSAIPQGVRNPGTQSVQYRARETEIIAPVNLATIALREPGS